MHLDQLRAGRGAAAGVRRRLHLDAEDDVPSVRDPIARAARDAGLLPDQVVVTASPTEALTEVHARGDVLLCTPAAAAAAGLRWRALGGTGVRRTYRLVGSTLDEPSAEARAALLVPLGRALGLRPVGEAAAPSGPQSWEAV